MQASSVATVVGLVDSNFHEPRTTAEIRRVFGEARNVTFTPMSLRSIFLATAKGRRGTKERAGA